jgi:cation diffusion facilitator CzcD-associated flavoprotein CzcO
MTEAVLVIGAGPAGLAAAAELHRRGVPVKIIERSDAVGSAWRGRYDRLRLNTCRWNSRLSGDDFPRGTPRFPGREQFVSYLESYVKRHDLPVHFGIQVDRVDRCGDQWRLATSAGDLTAGHVIFATGHQHTPRLPDWPGLRDFRGPFLHSSEYRDAGQFRGADVLVAGAGSSALDIAYDLAQGGAARVRVSVRTRPHMLLRSTGPIPTDLLALLLFRMPAWLGDQVGKVARRSTIGNLGPWGLAAPTEGLLTHMRRVNRTPTIVDREMIEAIKAGRIEIVADVASVADEAVRLTDGTALSPDAIIAATGFTTGLEPLVGHLGVLDDRGLPRASGGPAVAPGLRFSGYVPNIRNLDLDARAVAEQVSQELNGGGRPAREQGTHSEQLLPSA